MIAHGDSSCWELCSSRPPSVPPSCISQYINTVEVTRRRTHQDIRWSSGGVVRCGRARRQRGGSVLASSGHRLREHGGCRHLAAAVRCGPHGGSRVLEPIHRVHDVTDPPGHLRQCPPPRPPRPVSTVRFQRLGLGVCAALSLHCRRCLVCDGEHVLFAGGRVRRRRCCQGSASSALEPTDVFREVYRARTRAPLSTASLLPLPKVAIRQFSEANVRTSSSFTRPSARSKACQGKP